MTPPTTPRPCHSHIVAETNPLAETNTRRAMWLTAIMMVIEIVGGWYFNSMALLADGWHMSSHVVAFGLALLAYTLARRLAHDPRFTFGTWKIEVLGGYTSAILLLFVAALMFYQSIARLITPSAIHYDEAITLAIIGLLVNLLCAWWLKDGHHHHGHSHAHDHSHDHTPTGTGYHHKDLNLRAAYIHVITDAATSVLAIIALFGGKLWGAAWLDPVMGIVGGVLVALWALGLLRDSGRALLDAEMDAPIVANIHALLAHSAIPMEIADLHVWRVGRGNYACVLSIRTEHHLHPDTIKQLLRQRAELVHITVEINPPERTAPTAGPTLTEHAPTEHASTEHGSIMEHG